MRFIAEDDFLRKITIDLLMLQYPIGECTALRMVCRLQFLYQLNLVSMQMQIFRQNSLHRGP